MYSYAPSTALDLAELTNLLIETRRDKIEMNAEEQDRNFPLLA